MATIRGNEAPEYRAPFNLQPGPLLAFNPYELARRASYWRPTRWILSRCYAIRWNRRRGVRWDLQAINDWSAAMIYGNTTTDEIEKILAQPSPLLTRLSWR